MPSPRRLTGDTHQTRIKHMSDSFPQLPVDIKTSTLGICGGSRSFLCPCAGRWNSYISFDTYSASVAQRNSKEVVMK